VTTLNTSPLKLLLLLSASSVAFGQGSQLPKYTVGTLPSASSYPTYTVQVIDGTSAIDCTVGGGSHNVLCTPFGGVWTLVNLGGSGTTANALTMNNSGSGSASGSTFNGSAAKTISYNSIGAQQALTLTTTGSSGAATLSSGTLNIPQYQGQISLTTTGTSGAASLIGNTLNIPQYGSGSGTVNSGTANQIAYYAGTGTAVSGTTTLPNGTTATTQSANDNSTNVATTAYADAVGAKVPKTCNANGCYRINADGTIEAWGTVTVSFVGASLGTGTIAFPNTGGDAFSSSPSLVTTPQASPSGSDDAVTSYTTGLSTSGATSVVRCGVNIGGSGCPGSMTTTIPVSWFAIGSN
jgi:hypothetical protein